MFIERLSGHIGVAKPGPALTAPHSTSTFPISFVNAVKEFWRWTIDFCGQRGPFCAASNFAHPREQPIQAAVLTAFHVAARHLGSVEAKLRPQDFQLCRWHRIF